jgi:hypothetical protein
MKDISTSQSFAQDTIRRGEVVPSWSSFIPFKERGHIPEKPPILYVLGVVM